MSNVLYETNGKVCIISVNRPEARNAVDRVTGDALAQAFRKFDDDPNLCVAVFTGTNGYFCSGADLKKIKPGHDENDDEGLYGNRLSRNMNDNAPMGVSRLKLRKPVIAAVEGYAVAGGMEMALWADMRVMAEDAIFGIFCRRFGVPLIDGGTQRLARQIGMSRALDLILTGRPVNAEEALQFGLANRVVPKGMARAEAEKIAAQIAEFPQRCMRSDRKCLYEGFDLPFDEAMAMEFDNGLKVIASGETTTGAGKFSSGTGRHADFKNLND